jgi:hypothetical protein
VINEIIAPELSEDKAETTPASPDDSGRRGQAALCQRHQQSDNVLYHHSKQVSLYGLLYPELYGHISLQPASSSSNHCSPQGPSGGGEGLPYQYDFTTRLLC